MKDWKAWWVIKDAVGWVSFFVSQLDKNTITVNGEDIRLKPGMQTTVEVQTGERRIIEYLLTPVMKGCKESVRER